MQLTSGGHANSNGMSILPSNETTTTTTTDVTNFNAKQRLTQSTPGSPQDHVRPTSIEVVGSAESLVGRVMIHNIYILYIHTFIEFSGN